MKSEVFNMDCIIGMKQYPDKYFDLAIVGPPYGINVNMNMCKKKGERGRYEKKQWDKSIPQKEYFDELFRVSKNQIIWGGNYFTQYLIPSMGWIFWDKMVSKGVSFSDGELAWTSLQIALKKITVPYCGFIGIETKIIHPTEKPILLYKHLINIYCEHGFKILDTHLGSGNSRIAAHEMGYYFIGYELDKDYFKSHENKFNQYKSQLKLF